MSNNPLLAKVKLPGKVFQLPSKALFYDPGVLAPSAKQGEIQVKPMSALAEMKLKSADLLISAKVLEEVCQECIPEILKPDDLLSKDVDAIFCFLMSSTYGDVKTVAAKHNCANAKEHTYNVSLAQMISNMRTELLDKRDLLFTCPLENGQIVTLRPVKFSETIAQINFRQDILKIEMRGEIVPRQMLEKMVLNDLLTVIAAVEDDGQRVTESGFIYEWLAALQKTSIDMIVKRANEASDWGIDFKQKLTCKDCNAIFDYDLDLNPINFFSG